MQELFSTPEREKLLRYLLEHPQDRIRIREVARKLTLSPALVSNVVGMLKRRKVVREERISMLNPLTRELKTLFNVEKLMDYAMPGLKRTPSILGTGVYGSWAEGTNRPESDIDLWIKVKKKPGEDTVANIEGSLREKLKTDISILVLTPERIQDLRRKDKVFYYALAHSKLLWGEGI